MNLKKLTSIIVLLLLVAQGCRKPQQPTPPYDKPLPPGELALRKITDPGEIPEFSRACHDLKNLQQAVQYSLRYLSKPSSRSYYPYGDITHEHAQASLVEFETMLASGLSGQQLYDAVREKFDFYISVGCDNVGTVLFTGYYTPIFNGSYQRTEQYKYPLYKMPADLVKGADGLILGQKKPDGRLTRYPSRAEIEKNNMLRGGELIWFEDPFEVYIAHVQGSAKARLPNGQIQTIGYAANNGHEYKSIAQDLIDDGKIPADQLSLATMISYFKQHPGDVKVYTWRNPRFVFFREEPGQPRGSLNEPVTEWRSIATDKSIYPRACLALLATQLPQVQGIKIVPQPYLGFALDQDTGGAIRAPGRCDVYMGQGIIAGKLAGQTRQEGKLYYFFLKPEFISTAGSKN